MEQTGWRKYIKDYRVWAACGAIVVAVIIWAVVRGVGPSVKLTALSVDERGLIAPDTEFLLEARSRPDLDTLREAITTDPEIAFDLAETESGSYRLTPLKPLDANSTITFTVYGAEFSFTVQNRLLVLSAFPADGSKSVPVNSGVEFTFNSRNVTPESFEAVFSLSPDVKGRFDFGNGRFAFYPEENFAYNTQYTVALSPELASEDGAALGEALSLTFTTISEQEQNLQSMFQLSGNGFSSNSLVSETPLYQVYIDQSIARPNMTVAVKLHAFDGWEEYLAALRASASRTRYSQYSATASIDVQELREYAAFDIAPIPIQNEDYDNGMRVLQFPETLPEGCYAVTFTLETGGGQAVRQMFLQVSDLSVFYMAHDQDLLVWVNDAATGGPVNGAEIEIAGSYRAKGTTGADGTAHISNALPPDSDADEISTFLTVKAGGRTFVDTDVYYSYYGDEDAESRKYMSYLFTDRPLYHTTDTIQIWGMIRPRSPGEQLPDNLTLELGDQVISQPVNPLRDGTFTAVMQIESLAASYAPLRLKMGEQELFYLSLRIEDFVKPVYTAVTAPEQPVYMLETGSSIGVSIDVSTFDGTPVSDFGVRLNAWGGGEQVFGDENLRTDNKGHARGELRITESPDTWYPRSYGYEFQSNEAQSENFYLRGNIYGIHRDVMLRAVPDLKSGGSRVDVSTHRIDISRIRTAEQIWEKNALKGGALSLPVTAEVYKVYYEKIKTGTHYDFVNRVSVDSYRYDRKEEIVDTQEFQTVNGAYTLTGLPVSNDEACYFVKLRTTDSKGRAVETTAYLGDLYSRYGSQDGGTHRYTLVKRTNPAEAVIEEAYGETRFNNRISEYEDDEDVTYLLMDNDLPVENMQGRLLYGVVQDRFSNVAMSDRADVTLPFSEELLPNYVITGAYFDGKHIFALENTHMYFNPRRRELEILLEPDKESYRPADEMTVSATVTNKFTGEPAADASVVLSVVDEAVFAIQEQSTNILQRMYESVYYPYIRKYTSYLQWDLGGPGEKGGGGGDNMRTKFEDTAHFAVGTTGADGKVSFTCKLPDNITSWRLTSLALTPGNHAGNTKAAIAATKEFFILPIVNETLLEGDSFAVGVYGSGRAVSDADTVNYRVTIAGNGVNESREVSATLREYAGAVFGGLKQGDYTVTIEAACGPYEDGVRLPFSVIESGVEVSLVKTFDLNNGITVNSLRYPVNIAFYSKGAKTYNAVFNSVYQISGGARADMRLARRYIALQFQKQNAKWYNASILEENCADLSGYSPLSLLPYSNRDLELTAKARLALPDMVSAGALRGLTAANIADYDGAKSAVYLAQALADEPVSANLNTMLESGGSLDYVDRMYLALAMAVSGDTDGARGWYDTLVRPKLEKLIGVSGDTALYVNAGDPARSNEDCTAAASLLATALATEDADGLVRYLAEKKSPYEPYLFEQLYYLQQFAPPAGNPASFRYTRDGKAVTVELDRHATYISFNKEQLAEADFTALNGDIYADVYYAGSPADASDNSQKLVGFTKKIEPVSGTFTVGGLVKVTLTPDFSKLDADVGDATLVVDDYIPTGMRFERYDYDFYSDSQYRGWYLNSRQGQRLQFTVYGLDYKGVRPLVYYARCATAGEYVVESAYINSASGGVWGLSERGAVNIE